MQQSNRDSWKPSPHLVYKLNFDAYVFSSLDKFSFGAVIRNDKGEVMAAKGPAVFCSEEAEFLACRKAIEFTMDAGFSEFIIEGDNSIVMHAISSLNANQSLLGNVVGDIQLMLRRLHWVSIDFTRRGGGEGIRWFMCWLNMREILLMTCIGWKIYLHYLWKPCVKMQTLLINE